MQIFLSLWGLVLEDSLFPFLLLAKIYCRDLNIPNPCSSLDPHPLIPTQPTFYILCIHPGPRCLECSYTSLWVVLFAVFIVFKKFFCFASLHRARPFILSPRYSWPAWCWGGSRPGCATASFSPGFGNLQAVPGVGAHKRLHKTWNKYSLQMHTHWTYRNFKHKILWKENLVFAWTHTDSCWVFQVQKIPVLRCLQPELSWGDSPDPPSAGVNCGFAQRVSNPCSLSDKQPWRSIMSEEGEILWTEPHLYAEEKMRLCVLGFCLCCAASHIN